MKRHSLFRTRPGIDTALGIAFAIIAGLLLLGYITHRLDPGAGPELDIPVAKCDIEMGALVTRGMVGSMKIPKRYLPPGTRRKPADVAGSRTLRFVGRGELFVASALAGSGGASLASRIPKDLRAYSVDLASNSGVGPELRPGDSVDLIWTSDDPPRTSTLLRGRLVLSAGSGSAVDGVDTEAQPVPSRVTLLVSPAEAELLAQAEGAGRISLSLCGIPAPVQPGD